MLQLEGHVPPQSGESTKSTWAAQMYEQEEKKKNHMYSNSLKSEG